MLAYLDHAATTHVRPEAAAALLAWLGEVGNPSSSHRAGQATRVAVEEARERVADVLGASPGDIVFTSSGTEADNLAVKGIVWGSQRLRPHVVTTAIEHEAVLGAVTWLAARGDIRLTIVPPQPDGRVDPERVVAAVEDDTLLVSVMAANNVTGAVNDVAMIGRALMERQVAFHVDAVQAFATRPLDVDQLHVDALALSAHKVGGPPGVGVAYLRRGVAIAPLLHGGGQERAVRSGTMTAALDAACGVALIAADATRPLLVGHARMLTDRLWRGLRVIGGIQRLGPEDSAHRLPSHLAVVIDGLRADDLIFALDHAGVAASAGAACSSGATVANHVLDAMGIVGDASLRMTVGATSTLNEVEYALDVLTDVVPKLRARRHAAAS